MKVGVDFDNTIVCYDRLFHALAVERGLIPDSTPISKTAVRDHLRSVGREDEWTKLQGIAYGPEIERAEPFPGVLDFFRLCRRRGIPTVIISHKTLYPYKGRRYNLHKSARAFLKQHGFLETEETGLSQAEVFLELTKEEKLARIGSLGVTHFVDDLPEFLAEEAFPSGVTRVLFDPERRYPEEPGRRAIAGWSEAPTVLDLEPAQSTPQTAPFPDEEPVRALLESAHVPDAGYRLMPITGGGNNRGFKLTAADGRTFFLKWYFRHPDDPRDRLGTECAVAEYCGRHGIDEVPRLAGRNDAAGLALFEFIEGRKPTADEIDETAVDAALDFYRKLNAHAAEADAERVPIASEACFSVQEHVERIGARVQALVEAAAASREDRDFRDFVRKRLAPAWADVYERIDKQYPFDAAGRHTVISQDDHRLSPSDFGFHNALKTPDGKLRFIDLEYAGWDGPSKLVCDFFCQVQVPVPRRYWHRFVETVAADLSWPADFARRVNVLLPAYRIKWCCIVLNVFLPTGSARRAFGTAQAASAERRAAQLEKARAVLDELHLDLAAKAAS